MLEGNDVDLGWNAGEAAAPAHPKRGAPAAARFEESAETKTAASTGSICRP